LTSFDGLCGIYQENNILLIPSNEKRKIFQTWQENIYQAIFHVAVYGRKIAFHEFIELKIFNKLCIFHFYIFSGKLGKIVKKSDNIFCEVINLV
jgi:hypothetical protein